MSETRRVACARVPAVGAALAPPGLDPPTRLVAPTPCSAGTVLATGFVGDARAAGALGACLSGAGSTIIAFTDTVAGVTRIESAFRAAAADTDLPGRIEVVAPRNTGAKVS